MWYVMQVLSGEEHRIIQQCKKQIDSECYRDIFVPRYVQKKRYRGQWHERQKTLFPGYVFIDTEDIKPFVKKLSQINGLTKLLRNADEIAPISGEEKQYLLDMMDDSYVVQISVGYLIGDQICITQGALKDYTGYISKIDRHRRTAELMVDFFGRKTKVQVGLEIIKKVTEDEFRQMKAESARGDSDVELASATSVDQPKGPADELSKDSLTSSPTDSRRVKITSGVFAGMFGNVLERNPKKKEVKVSVRLFGEETSVVFREEEISYCL